LWAIDPKRAEFADPSPSISLAGVFKRRAYGEKEIAALLSDLHSQILGRVTGRDFVPSAHCPWLILLIDEFSNLFDGFADSRLAKAAEADLRVILSQGRAAGIVVVAAAQEPTKATIALRNLFPQRIAMRVATPAETDMALGPGSVSAGATPHEIEVASPTNNYKTAGIAWVRDGNGVLTRCRFPYTTDTDIESIAAQYPVRPYQPSLDFEELD
jgi:S-DNA-T family DNA segregation ATPase FtsK/SpoIIIE